MGVNKTFIFLIFLPPVHSKRLNSVHKERLGKAPCQISVDGGFASRNNLAFAKGCEVKDTVFAKKRGLTVIEMAKSAWVYKMLSDFRAGIGAGIST